MQYIDRAITPKILEAHQYFPVKCGRCMNGRCHSVVGWSFVVGVVCGFSWDLVRVDC